MDSKIVFILLLLGVLLIVPVCAESEQVTMRVDSKMVVGMGTGNSPFDVDEFINPLYLVCERETGTSAHYIVQEYPVSLDDYCKVKVGDTITLEKPMLRTDAWKLVN